jgi:protein pelota
LNIELHIGTVLSSTGVRPDERIRKPSAANRPEVEIRDHREGEAVIGYLRQYGIEEVSRVRQASSGKREGTDARSEFFAEVARQLKYADKVNLRSPAGFIMTT